MWANGFTSGAVVNGTRFLALISESCVWEEREAWLWSRGQADERSQEPERKPSFSVTSLRPECRCSRPAILPSSPAPRLLSRLPYLEASPLRWELSRHYVQTNDSSSQLMQHSNGDRLHTIVDKNPFSNTRNIMDQITKHVQVHWPSASQQTINILPFIWLILSSAYER